MEYKFLEDMKQAFSMWLDCIDKILQENTRLQEEVGEYRTALEVIRDMFLNQVALVEPLTNFEEEIYNKINEVLHQTKDIGFWDSEGNYKEDIQEIDIRELKD